MAAAGLPHDPTLVFERSFEFVDGRAAMHSMLARADPPSAVFCANDIQAIGAMYECQEAGVRVPQDMSIIGFDDLPIARYVTPQLTTIRVPAAEMGARAARALIDALEAGDEVSPCNLATDLIVRGTTAPPRQV